MLILGVETSCDETAISVVRDGEVLSNEISSSVHLHAQYGGVVPEIASRYHVEYIYAVFKSAIQKASINLSEIDLIAVTERPGLPGSLLVGSSFAKTLGYVLGKPVSGIDHLKAHVLSAFIRSKKCVLDKDLFPFVGVVISGGHCNIYSCRGLNEFEIIGRTRDDAAGEAFDKVAKMMGLGYPGGPIIEKYALEYEDKQTVPFPRAMLDDPDSLDFSFSGLKTAVLYYWKSTGGTKDDIRRICSSFQTAVADVIAKKIERSLRITGYDTIAFGGGVMNNRHIRKIISSLCNSKDVELYMAEKDFCADNAAMVAITADILYNDTMPIDVY